MTIKTDARMFLLAVIAAASTLARAQTPVAVVQKPQPLPALEVTYDYIHSNGPPNNCGCFSMNGGGAAYVHPLRSSSFALVGKLGVDHAGGISASNLALTLFTYTVGARFYPTMKDSRWHPYGELQVGGAHASGNLLSGPNPAGSNTHSAFAGSLGAGVDLSLNRRLSIKLADVEYLATTFANGSTDHQNNLRVSAGVVVHFGK